MSGLFVVLKEGHVPGPYPNAMMAQQSGALVIDYGLVLVGLISFIFISLTMLWILRHAYRVQQETNGQR